METKRLKNTSSKDYFKKNAAKIIAKCKMAYEDYFSKPFILFLLLEGT